jgi:hypothetical protein
VVELLSSKCKALSSNPSTKKKVKLVTVTVTKMEKQRTRNNNKKNKKKKERKTIVAAYLVLLQGLREFREGVQGSGLKGLQQEVKVVKRWGGKEEVPLCIFCCLFTFSF